MDDMCECPRLRCREEWEAHDQCVKYGDGGEVAEPHPPTVQPVHVPIRPRSDGHLSHLFLLLGVDDR